MNAMNDLNTLMVGILGDTHCNTGWIKIALNNFHLHGVNVILSVGDFGVWRDNRGRKFRYVTNKTLTANDQILFVTLGNHEDYTIVENFVAHPDYPDHVYDPNYPRIVYATRGARWEWNDVSFVSLGGANSIDFQSRTEWVDWWKQEQITLGDVYRTVAGGHAEIMITHDCPQGVNLWGSHRDASNGWSATALRYAQQSRDTLRQAVDGVKPEILFHGHYHFHADHVTVLNDGLDDYTIRTVGLDMDEKPANMGVLHLPEKKFEIIPLLMEAKTYQA